MPHGEETNEKITIVYVPSHLYHIAFELIKVSDDFRKKRLARYIKKILDRFKNAMRAAVEYNTSLDTTPAIKLTVVKGKEDISIKVNF